MTRPGRGYARDGIAARVRAPEALPGSAGAPDSATTAIQARLLGATAAVIAETEL